MKSVIITVGYEVVSGKTQANILVDGVLKHSNLEPQQAEAWALSLAQRYRYLGYNVTSDQTQQLNG